MAARDTNGLVRFIVAVTRLSSQRSKGFLRRAIADGSALFGAFTRVWLKHLSLLCHPAKAGTQLHVRSQRHELGPRASAGVTSGREGGVRAVTLELEWVPRSRYGFGKTTVLETFARLLSSVELDFESESIVAVALALRCMRVATRHSRDCLHAASAEQPLWAFDRTASKLIVARLLSASR